MGGTHAHPHLHLGTNGNERLEHCSVVPSHIVRRRSAFRCAGKCGRVRGGSGMGPMHREHPEMNQQEHRSPGDEHDDRIERQQLAPVSTISLPCGGFVRLPIAYRDAVLWGAHGPPPTTVQL
jgi:hypothetical protein